MQGQNFLFNQPLAMDSNYLLSLLPSLVLGFQNNSFQSAEKVEQQFKASLEAQMNIGGSGTLSQYPVVFHITGPIVKYTNWNYIGTQSMIAMLKQLDRNPQVSGILFNIDSGGGMVSGTAEFADFISKMNKPTIAFTNDTQCSAAQWIASACKLRIAGPHARMIGSIGTYTNIQDFSAMFEKWGAKIHEIYAPQSTEKNIEYRELMDNNNKELYEGRLLEITEEFINSQKKNYGDSLKDDGSVFKGKVYNAQQALEIGLVEEICTMEEALAKF